MLNLVVYVFQEVDCWWSPDPPSVRELVYGSFVARAGNHGDVWTPSFALKPDWWYSTHITSSPLILCKDLTQVRHPVENMWNSLVCSFLTAATTIVILDAILDLNVLVILCFMETPEYPNPNISRRLSHVFISHRMCKNDTHLITFICQTRGGFQNKHIML